MKREGHPPGTVKVGVISDTHGLMRPAALDALRGSHHIIHAGDVGRADVLAALRTLAPLTVVRGNVDHGPGDGLPELPETAEVEFAGHCVHVRHIVEELDLDPEAAGFAVVIFGHSHRPSIERKGDVLYLNPGSAGPRRFSLPISVARLDLSPSGVQAELIDL